VKILPPLNPGKTTIDLGVPEDALDYRVPNDVEHVVVQRDMRDGGAWPTGTVPIVTLKHSLDGGSYHAFAAGAVTYNTEGIGAAVSVVPGSYLRLYVSTIAASTGETMRPVLRGYKDTD